MRNITESDEMLTFRIWQYDGFSFNHNGGWRFAYTDGHLGQLVQPFITRWHE